MTPKTNTKMERRDSIISPRTWRDHGLTIWLTGPSGVGKTTIARALGSRLASDGRRIELLDVDDLSAIRRSDFGCPSARHSEVTDQFGYMARLLARNGVIVIVATESPIAARRSRLHETPFIGVRVECPMGVLCERVRNACVRPAVSKLDYSNSVPNVYEETPDVELSVDTGTTSVDDCVTQICGYLASKALVEPPMELDPTRLVVNPTLRLEIGWRLRQRNSPIRRGVITSEHDELVNFLLQSSVLGPDTRRSVIPTLSADRRRMAVEMGFLVATGDVPGPPSRFRCEITNDTLTLVPPVTASATENGTSEERWLNPRCWVQTDAEPPTELRHRTIADERLRSHMSGVALKPLPTINAAPPVIWIEHPLTGGLEFVGTSGLVGGVAIDLINGDFAPSTLNPEMKEAFTLAGILWREPPPEKRARRQRKIAQLAERLRTSGYAVLHDAVSPLQMAALRQHFRLLRGEGFFQLDTEQVKGMREGMYSELTSLFFQRQFLNVISEITQEALKPSYTWVVRYQPGAELARHTDRAQCRWNVSLCVDSSPDLCRANAWPLFLEVDRATTKVMLGMGDAVIYSGTNVPHWRRPLAANQTVTMCLFHYIDEHFSGPIA